MELVLVKLWDHLVAEERFDSYQSSDDSELYSLNLIKPVITTLENFTRSTGVVLPNRHLINEESSNLLLDT